MEYTLGKIFAALPLGHCALLALVLVIWWLLKAARRKDEILVDLAQGSEERGTVMGELAQSMSGLKDVVLLSLNRGGRP